MLGFATRTSAFGDGARSVSVSSNRNRSGADGEEIESPCSGTSVGSAPAALEPTYGDSPVGWGEGKPDSSERHATTACFALTVATSRYPTSGAAHIFGSSRCFNSSSTLRCSSLVSPPP